MTTSALVELVELLKYQFGEDVWDDSVQETARRVLAFWDEYTPREMDFNPTVFDAGELGAQLIVCKDIEFSSVCSHHLLPFYGKAHVGYIPHELMIGLSKIPRIVDHFARRPQVQERLTHDIASYLKHLTHAKGVAVVVEARHTCMACRGVRKHNGVMVTSDVMGIFLTAPAAREEFMSLIKGSSV